MKKYLSVTDNRVFSRAYSKGATHANRLTAVYVQKNANEADCGLYLGITVNRKLGKAVYRNRVKRLVREALRAEAELLQGGLTVIIAARTAAFSRNVKEQDIQNQLKYSLNALGMYKGQTLCNKR